MDVVRLVFEGDMCGEYPPQELTTHDLLELPHCGDVLKISGMWHYVITTCFSLDEKAVSIHLGSSCKSMEDAMHWPEQHLAKRSELQKVEEPLVFA